MYLDSFIIKFITRKPQVLFILCFILNIQIKYDFMCVRPVSNGMFWTLKPSDQSSHDQTMVKGMHTRLKNVASYTRTFESIIGKNL